MNEPVRLDAAAIERLRRLGGDKFAREMIGLFLTYVDQKITEARRAQQAGNLPGVQKAVHPVKSSAGNVGARCIQELAKQIEDSAKQQQGEAVDKLLTELEQAFADIKPDMEAEQAKLSAS